MKFPATWITLGRGIAMLILAGACLGISATAALAQPAVTAVTPTGDGYQLTGRGFGRDKSRIQVFENATLVAPSAIVSVTDNAIVVRSRPSGTVQHRVVVGGVVAAMGYTHPHGLKPVTAPEIAPPPRKPPPTQTGSAGGPRRIALGTLSASGFRTDAVVGPPARRVALAGLSASGHRADAEASARARRLSLGTLSAEGWRQ